MLPFSSSLRFPSKQVAQTFRADVVNSKESDSVSLAPVREVLNHSCVYLRSSNVYLVAVTRSNVNAMATMTFLSRMVEVVRSYCAGEFNEEVVKANFVLIYELLDEVLDFGYPQVSDGSVLKSLIFQKGFATEATKKKRAAEAQNATLQVTGAVGWRKDGIRYKKNELFLDVIETVSVLLSAQGAPLRTDVVGRLVMKACLSGMPDVKLGLNDKLEDVVFHPCVNLGRYAVERVVSFVPPDGEFELMRYRVAEGIALPFKAAIGVTERGRTRLDVRIALRAAFPAKLWAAGVVAVLPVPEQTARASFELSAGKAKYDPRRGALVWKLKRVAGESEHTLSAAVELIATTRERKPWAKQPLALTFSIPMYSASGMRVQYLKVWEKSSYKVDKWVRKLCKSGDYHARF